MNAIIGFPDELKTRVKLRSEFIRLSFLQVLEALNKERHVEVVRQVLLPLPSSWLRGYPLGASAPTP